MRDHYREPLDIEQLSNKVPISRRLLEKRFRKSLDCTPHTYLCRLRCEEAKKLLISSPRTKIHTIAKNCGFSSQDHMRLVFLRIVGMTPKEYRSSGGKK
jgi:transcriptional regulator GlxA family with amidase domain